MFKTNIESLSNEQRCDIIDLCHLMENKSKALLFKYLFNCSAGTTVTNWILEASVHIQVNASIESIRYFKKGK